jgi:ribosomal protein L37AE/L43A
MRTTTAFVDEVAMARGFSTDDIVRKTGLRDLLLSPYVGRVLYSDLATGKVSVQWPWGEQQESPVELVKDTSGDLMPPEFVDQGYATWEKSRWTAGKEVEKSDAKWRKKLSTVAERVADRYLNGTLAQRVAAKYEYLTLPVWRLSCKAWHEGLDEFEAFKKVSSEYSEQFGFDTVQVTVANLYELGRRLGLYWKDSKRKYRVTQKEKSSGKFACPRCKNLLKPRVYRQGRRVLMCKTCGFTIHPKDLV